MTNEEQNLLITYLGRPRVVQAWFQDRQPDARRGPLQG